jgi:hypothetical protein
LPPRPSERSEIHLFCANGIAILIAGFWAWRLILRGAVEKLRKPVLASFDGSTAARVAVRCAVRAPRRRAMDRDLDDIAVV